MSSANDLLKLIKLPFLPSFFLLRLSKSKAWFLSTRLDFLTCLGNVFELVVQTFRVRYKYKLVVTLLIMLFVPYDCE